MDGYYPTPRLLLNGGGLMWMMSDRPGWSEEKIPEGFNSAYFSLGAQHVLHSRTVSLLFLD